MVRQAEIDDWRGKQQVAGLTEVSSIAFIFPAGPPRTDEALLEHQRIIDSVKLVRDIHSKAVSDANAFIKQMERDCSMYLRDELPEEDPGLFDGQEDDEEPGE